jgi:hypothetical protein
MQTIPILFRPAPTLIAQDDTGRCATASVRGDSFDRVFGRLLDGDGKTTGPGGEPGKDTPPETPAAPEAVVDGTMAPERPTETAAPRIPEVNLNTTVRTDLYAAPRTRSPQVMTPEPASSLPVPATSVAPEPGLSDGLAAVGADKPRIARPPATDWPSRQEMGPRPVIGAPVSSGASGSLPSPAPAIGVSLALIPHPVAQYFADTSGRATQVVTEPATTPTDFAVGSPQPKADPIAGRNMAVTAPITSLQPRTRLAETAPYPRDTPRMASETAQIHQSTSLGKPAVAVSIPPLMSMSAKQDGTIYANDHRTTAPHVMAGPATVDRGLNTATGQVPEKTTAASTPNTVRSQRPDPASAQQGSQSAAIAGRHDDRTSEPTLTFAPRSHPATVLRPAADVTPGPPMASARLPESARIIPEAGSRIAVQVPASPGVAPTMAIQSPGLRAASPGLDRGFAGRTTAAGIAPNPASDAPTAAPAPAPMPGRAPIDAASPSSTAFSSLAASAVSAAERAAVPIPPVPEPTALRATTGVRHATEGGTGSFVPAMSAAGLRTIPDNLRDPDIGPVDHLAPAAPDGGGIARAPVTVPHVAGAPDLAARLTDILARHAGGPVEIALSPEELGRVRMALHPVDGGITVSFVTERSETQDLIRRHIDQLGAELRALGYGSVSFSFSGDSSSGAYRQPPDPPAPAGPETPDPTKPDATPSALRTITTGLDLRM